MTPRPRLKTRAAIALSTALLITPLAGMSAVAAPTMPPPTTDAPTEAPTEPPALAAPESAEVGDTIAITGQNFPPETQITIALGEEITTDATSDRQGAFSAEVTIPVDYSAGPLTATAAAQDGTEAETQIAIEVPEHEPKATFSTTTPVRGETITITSKGHLPGETVTVSELPTDTLSGEKSEVADDKGTAIVEYPIPNDAPPLATLNVFDVHQNLPIATELLTIRDPEPTDDANADAGADGGNANAAAGGNADDGANPGDNANGNADAGAGGDGAGDNADAGAEGGSADADDKESSSAGKDGTEPPPIDVDDWDNNDPAAPVDEGSQPNDPFADPGDNTPVDSGDEPRDDERTEAPSPVEDTTDEPTTEAPDTQADDSPAASGIGVAGVAAFGAGIVVLAGLALLGYFIARKKKQ